MDSHSIFALLTLAFSLGLVHALDADHVMAISNLIGRRPGFKQSLVFCSRWAIGHGTALLIFGFFVFILGQAIPDSLSAYAELGVGIVLIVLGVWTLWDLRRQNAHIHFHQHDGLPEHAHWHTHVFHKDDHNSKHTHTNDTHLHYPHPRNSHSHAPHSHNHSAVMIGLLHGTAGSAPLLALLPLTQISSPWIGLAYLSVFAVGVLLAMMIFGGVLSGVMQWLQRFGHKVINGFRVTVALSSMLFGLHLLFGSQL